MGSAGGLTPPAVPGCPEATGIGCVSRRVPRPAVNSWGDPPPPPPPPPPPICYRPAGRHTYRPCRGGDASRRPRRASGARGHGERRAVLPVRPVSDCRLTQSAAVSLKFNGRVCRWHQAQTSPLDIKRIYQEIKGRNWVDLYLRQSAWAGRYKRARKLGARAAYNSRLGRGYLNSAVNSAD